jgi:2-hydroxychromene-2-carboxylate isomerase
MADPTVDVWFDFASPYSYLAVHRIRPLARAAGVRVRLRPMLLGPILRAQGFETSPFNVYPDKGRYMWRDLERLCAELGLPFRRPDPFPQNGLRAARTALVGLAEAWGEDFCRAVFHAEFGEARQIDDPGVIAGILARLDVDAGRVLTLTEAAETKLRLRLETEAAQRLGIFGVPSTVTPDGELFWGNDRLDQALAWAKTRHT